MCTMLIFLNMFSFSIAIYGIFPSTLMFLSMGVAVSVSPNVGDGFAIPSGMLVYIYVLVTWRCTVGFDTPDTGVRRSPPMHIDTCDPRLVLCIKMYRCEATCDC